VCICVCVCGCVCVCVSLLQKLQKKLKYDFEWAQETDLLGLASMRNEASKTVIFISPKFCCKLFRVVDKF